MLQGGFLFVPRILFHFNLLCSNHPIVVMPVNLRANKLIFIPFGYNFGGGWLYLYSFIYLSAGVVEWQPYCFVIILLHHAPLKMASVLVLFVIFEGFFLVLVYM